MATNTSKIEKYINDVKNKSSYELANEELLKLFGDEETYNRFVLANLNYKIGKSFAVTRSDGLYISCEMALRNFDGSYLDFSKFHNYDRFSYPVIQTALNHFYYLELGLFCCGAKESTSYIQKLGYYDMFNNNSSERIYTPEVICVDRSHKNYELIKKLGIDRDKNLPFINMDAKTLSAFTHFRIMAFNKFKENLECGIEEKVRELKLGRFYYPNSNAYVAYALALKDTCEYFKAFYSPDDVTFTDTKLPYKGLAVIEQKVNNIKEKYNLETIGTIRHFNSALNLPMTNQDFYHISNLIVKMIEFKGQYVRDKDLYKLTFAKVKNVMLIPNGMEFDQYGRSIVKNEKATKTPPIDLEQETKDKEFGDKIDEVLQDSSIKLSKKLEYREFPELDSYTKHIKENSENNNILASKAITQSQVLITTKQKIDVLKAKKGTQLPMFFEIELYGETKYIPNAVSFVDSKTYPKFVDSFKMVVDKFYEICREKDTLVVDYKRLSQSAKNVQLYKAELEASWSSDRKKGRYVEHELYNYVDPEKNEKVIGNYEEYQLAESKREYIENYAKVVKDVEKINALQIEFKNEFEDVKLMINEMLQNEGFTKEDFDGVIDLLNAFEPETQSNDSLTIDE